MEDSLVLQLSGCSPTTPSPQPRNTCRLVPLLSTPAEAPELELCNGSAQKTSTSTVLAGVVAYVDVRTQYENRSRAIGLQLERLGATVVDRFTDDVTHFVYRDGKKRALNMALRRKVHLVSVLWIESCKQNQRKVPEEEFHVTPPLKPKFKRYKSMQPIPFEEDVARSEERIRRRRQRKQKHDKRRIMQTPERTLTKNFFVADTCQRSPSDSEWVRPQAIRVPETPPSMRNFLARKLAQVPVSPSAPATDKSPLSRGTLDSVPRRMAFDTDVGSPEVISVSTGSAKSSLSSPNDSNPCGKTAEGSDIKSSGETLSGWNGSSVQLMNAGKLKANDSVSPEIELQNLRRLAHVNGLNSSSSQELQKNVKADETWEKEASPKSSHLILKVSMVSDKTSTADSRGNLLQHAGNNLKRKNSPSLEEETAFPRKRSRTEDDVVGRFGRIVKERTVSLIPLSQLNSVTVSSPVSSPVSSLVLSEKRNGLRKKNLSTEVVFTEMNTDGYTIPKKVSTTTKAKSFVQSSPTSSQEASRSYPTANGGLQSPHLLKHSAGDFPGKFINSVDVTPLRKSLQSIDVDVSQNCVTPFSQPLSCADSLVLETRVQKRRILAPCQEMMTTDGSPGSRLKMSRENTGVDLGDVVMESSVSSPKVILPRLPRAWCRPSSDSSSRSSISIKNAVSMNKAAKNQEPNLTPAGPLKSEDETGCTKSILEPEMIVLEKRKKSEEMICRNSGKEVSRTSSTVSSKSSPALIAITSLHRGDQKLVSDAIQQLGSYSLTEQVDERTTHVISGENRRTVKVLSGIMRGLWILSLDWVKHSASRGRWLPEDSYELTNFFPAAKTSRLEKERIGSDYRQDLFSKVGDVFVVEGSSPPRNDLEQLITVGCGKVTKQLRLAKVCVGRFLRRSIVNVSEQWILDSITQHECLPTANYILTP